MIRRRATPCAPQSLTRWRPSRPTRDKTMDAFGNAGLLEAFAFPARPPALIRPPSVRVRLVERVSALAVRLLLVATRDGCCRTEDVDARGYRLHMRRVDAAWVPAQMVDCQADGDRSTHQLVSDTMRPKGYTNARLDTTVAAYMTGQPRPTGIWPARSVGLLPQAILDRTRRATKSPTHCIERRHT